MSPSRGVFWISRFCIVGLALVVAAGAQASEPKKKGGGGGFTINVPGLILNAPIGKKPMGEGAKKTPAKESHHCDRGYVYSARLEKCVKQNTGPKIVVCVPPMVLSPRGCVLPAPVVVQCRAPAVYSPGLKRCVVPEPKVVVCRAPQLYSKTLGRCYTPEKPKVVVSCDWPTVRSGSVCVCARGYVSAGGGRCVKPPSAPPVPAIDVTEIQQCLAKLGYDPGPIDGDLGRATKAAYNQWQESVGLEPTSSVTDEQTNAALYAACEETEVAALPEPIVEEVAISDDPPPPAAGPVSQGKCIAPDLYAMLTEAYGEKPDLAPCTDQTAACLPRPAFYSEAKLATVAAAEGIRWCDSCVTLNSWLPLNSILQIEAAAGITLCASPPALCYLPARPVIQKTTEVRTIYKALPVSVGNEGDIAVVVGNETYGNDITPNVYGHADADAVIQLLTEQLGYRKENIIDLRDATLADLERVFGSAVDPMGELAARIGKEQPGDVFVYVSSHGLSTESGDAYLVPVDARVDAVAETAYPLQRLYDNIGKSGARTTMLLLEASFGKSITDAVDPPNIPETEVLTMPVNPVPGLAVFTAGDRDQRTLEDPEYGIGLFTRYLIAGLAGEADISPIGNGDQTIDTVELFVYASDMVRTAARKSFGLEQKLLLSKIDNLVVGKLAAL